MQFHYEFTRLLVSDFAACFRFYRDVMGFEVGTGDEQDIYADFKVGQVNISLFDRNLMSAAVGTTDAPFEAPAQDKVCLTFAVDNVDETWEKIKQLGVTLVAEPVDRPEWMIRTAHFRDPDDNLIEINQPLS